MSPFDHLMSGFAVALSWKSLFYCFVGCLWGTIVGVLPGLGPLAGMTLLLPLTFGLDPANGIIMLTGIFYGAMYGGSTTSILVRIPGEAASVVTCIDGYEMARQGRAGPALMIAAVGSFIGGTVSVLGLMLVAPPLARVMVAIGPSVEVVLMLLALCVITLVSGGSRLKTAAMIVLGLAVGTVGLDKLTGMPRFTFGNLGLADGLSFTALAIGLFGISEILFNLEKSETIKAIRPKLRISCRAGTDLREVGAGDRPRHRRGLHFRHHSGRQPRGVDVRLLRDGEALLQASRAVRQGRDRRRGGAGDRQQRHHRHRHDPAAGARHPVDPRHRDPALGAHHPRRAAGAAAADRQPAGVLGPGRQHVYRQRRAADPEPAVRRRCS